MNRTEDNHVEKGISLAVGLAVSIGASYWIYKKFTENMVYPDLTTHPSAQLAIEARQLFEKGFNGKLSWDSWEAFEELMVHGDMTTLKNAPTLWKLHRMHAEMPVKDWAAHATKLAQKPVSEIHLTLQEDYKALRRADRLKASCLGGMLTGLVAGGAAYIVQDQINRRPHRIIV